MVADQATPGDGDGAAPDMRSFLDDLVSHLTGALAPPPARVGSPAPQPDQASAAELADATPYASRTGQSIWDAAPVSADEAKYRAHIADLVLTMVDNRATD